MDKKIKLPWTIFESTWIHLREVGRGRAEAVAVWGGVRTKEIDEVKKVYFFDQENVHRGRRLHRVPSEEINALFKHLRADGLNIIADVHTHPGAWVGLSPVDEANPTEFRRGFVSVVIPCFGMPAPEVQSVGAHLYRGNGKWEEVPSEELFVLCDG